VKDEFYMQRCLELAQLGAGSVASNPMVGAVIVWNEQIIGEGYHERYGEAHAEVNAIKSVKDKSLLPEATIYVSLEPCAHHGKTPPCSDLLIQQRFKTRRNCL
jgi:diaminohydroxyphosphoribosylaminopyrimidine deaminase / 5-amino-6-(5-phosphoribosylamino)uracil reductase